MTSASANSDNNLRKHARIGMVVNVELTLPDLPPQQVRTRNVSSGGLFLVVENPQALPIGEMVKVKLLNSSEDGGEPLAQDAVIVRHDTSGIGLAFIEIDEGL